MIVILAVEYVGPCKKLFTQWTMRYNWITVVSQKTGWDLISSLWLQTVYTNKYNCSDLPPFGSQRYIVGYQTNQNHYITFSMLKINSIHKSILKILGSHEIKSYAYLFHHVHPKTIEETLRFPWICTSISLFHLFILQLESIFDTWE